MQQLINILDICNTGCKTLGPGLRYVIWTQGCPFHCKGCVTPEGRSIEGGIVMPVTNLVEDIVTRSELDGLTISGGEPFLQAKSLAELVRQTKERRPEMTVLIFTGFRLEELNNGDSEELLSMTDVLIDGRYDDTKNDGIGLRGSSNQRIHFLTDRLVAFKNDMEYGKRKVEAYIENDKIKMLGIPITKEQFFNLNNNTNESNR